MANVSVSPTDRLFVLTGAGISAESGLPTFRAEDGLWAGNRIEDVCTPEAWDRNPARRVGFLFRAPRGTARRPSRIQPTSRWPSWKPARRPLLPLHAERGRPARARRLRRLVHMHGELAKAHCENDCGRPPVDDHATSTPALEQVGRCPCGGGCARTSSSSAKFPSRWTASRPRSSAATLMLVVGTSGSVYPAANFVHWARQAGARTVYVGPEPPLNASAFTHVVEGKAGEALPGLFLCE